MAALALSGCAAAGPRDGAAMVRVSPQAGARATAAARMEQDAKHPASASPTLWDRQRLTARVARYLHERDGRAGVMAEDLRTGAVFGYGQYGRFITASVAKVNILTGLLLSRQAAHRGLTGGERATAAQMIRYSDNNAADDLYGRLGQGPGMTRVDQRLGLAHTVPFPTAWGATWTCPYDQVRLLHLLTDASSPLSPANRHYVLSLMGRVSADQRWGVSAGAQSGDTVALKNGWTPMHYEGSGWAVNSIGRVTGGGHDVLLAVFSAEQPSMDTGIATIEHLTRLAMDALRTS